MGNRDQFSVTISRINDGPRDSPYETVSAHRITLDPDGTLVVYGEIRGRTFSAGVWNSIEIRRLTGSSTGSGGKA